MNTTDALLGALLADVRASPGDPLPVLALADYLSEQPPTPVELGHVPDWLRRAWPRARKNDRPRRAWQGIAAGWAVLSDVGEWLAAQSASHYWRLDHAGITVVGGLACFASEPYAALEVAREQARCLATKVKCVGVGLDEGRWRRGTVRVLLLPGAKEVQGG